VVVAHSLLLGYLEAMRTSYDRACDAAEVTRLTCPDCQGHHIIRHGYTPQRVQRFRCRGCGHAFISEADRRSYTPLFKQQVMDAYQERASMRGISRVFGISRNTLTKWLKEKGGSCPI